MSSIHVFLLLSAAALLVGLYKTFEKAGEKGWKAFVPVYNFVVWLKIIQKPWWWIFLVMIPTVGFYMLAIMIVLLLNCFGKRKFIEHVFAVVAYFIWVPYLGFSQAVKWQGVPAPEKNKPWWKEWGEAGIFAIVAATLIRTFFFEAFVIPSSSMEGTLLVGDYLFVSKMSYGAKVPAIPLTIPFTHNTMPFSETAVSYLDWIELPYMRLPGFGSVERNDIVVFNFPEGDSVYIKERNSSYYQMVRDNALMSGKTTDQVRQEFLDNNEVIVHPVDKEDNYVKRCIGIPGDRIEVRNRVLFVNGKEAMTPEHMQFSYDVGGNVNPSVLAKSGIESRPKDNGELTIFVNNPQLEQLKPSLTSVKINVDTFAALQAKGMLAMSTNNPPTDLVMAYLEPFNLFPHAPKTFQWTRDNYGPLVIPKEGMTVKLSLDSLPLWERVIRVYEGNTLEVKDGKIFINGSVATTYTFKQDYYFMMGDNRHNSLDSRYWGYVPADHIVGKPVFVWMSKGDATGMRPERMMSFVSKDGLSKSHLWWVLGGILVIVGFNYFRNRKKGNSKPAVNVSKKK